MSDQGSITRLIGGLRTGDSEAESGVWERFYTRLLSIARQKLRNSNRRIADEEDIVVDAFDSFFRGARNGRFPKLDDRDDLWEVLFLLTCRKSTNQILFDCRKKRGNGKVKNQSSIGNGGGAGIDDALCEEPSPEFAAELTEQFAIRLKTLGDPLLERIALMKLEGYTNKEIADRIDRQERTVQRKLRTIRAIWLVDENE